MVMFFWFFFLPAPAADHKETILHEAFFELV